MIPAADIAFDTSFAVSECLQCAILAHSVSERGGCKFRLAWSETPDPAKRMHNRQTLQGLWATLRPKMHFRMSDVNGLGVPDVSRERRCLQTSPEQLKATKDKKDKNWNFRPREAREFLGRWDENSNTVKTQKFHTSGVCLREDKNSRTKIGQ